MSYIKALGACVVMGMCVPSPGLAQTPKPDVEFDHSDGTPKIFSLALSHGQKFTVRIAKTCPDAFDYSYEGVKSGTRAQAALAALSDKDIDVVYDQQFGGYVFSIKAKEGVNAGETCTGGETLKPTTFIVSVRHETWNLSFSGGFTISGLTDRVFALKTENAVKTVIEEPDKEDSHKLGAASFVHLFHDNVAWKQLQPALGFGLGINGDNRAEYLVGAGLRFGDRATFNVGRVWGSVARLPNGVTLGAPATDDNVLNNLGSQVVSRWFFALTYAFIDTKDRLLKPFAQESAGGGAGGTAAEAKAAGAVTEDALEAVKAAAADPKTYEGVGALKSMLDASGANKVDICGADAKASADGKSIEATVHLKAASNAQLGILNGANVASGARAAIGQRAKPAQNVTRAAFDSGKCPQ
jgi:hypothetical protein